MAHYDVAEAIPNWGIWGTLRHVIEGYGLDTRIDIRSFGATSDTTAAVQAATDVADEGDVLWFPPGDWSFTLPDFAGKTVWFDGPGVPDDFYDYRPPVEADSQHVVDDVRRGKGGVVGTDGKGVVAFRFDHRTDEFLADVWPLLTARGLPASFGVVTDSIGDPVASYEPTVADWADLQTVNKQGCEMWAHSATHADPADSGTHLAYEVVGPRDTIESNGMRCVGWQQPGAPATYGTGLGLNKMTSDAGRLIRRSFGLYEATTIGTEYRTLPAFGTFGGNHVTIDAMSEADIIAVIDAAAAYKTGVELMLHATALDAGANLTTAGFTAVLDYVTAAREAGTLEVLTASGLAFADPSTAQRLDLITDGTFVGLSTGTLGHNWSDGIDAGSWTIESTGGVVGDEFLRIPSDKTRVAHDFPSPRQHGLDGHTFVFTGYCRSTVGGANARVRIASGTGIVLDKTDIVLAESATWTRVWVPFTIYPLTTNFIQFQIGRFFGGSVDWDDVHVYAV